ncbi:MAG: type IV toxin-antitoxin system AbiEi family antitoxin domain-containing protein [Lachnospiraceae bacterium]|jgi:predicted transcriptional regulator of viral defense system
MIKTTAMLLEELKEYTSPKSKLSRMVERGECFPITRGLYETDPNVPAHLLAGSIYGPSYISFEYALGYYGLIPEAVYTVTCATFEKKKKKKYETSFGAFTYRDVPSEAFPLGIRLIQEGDYFYRIAEPEKALCDQLYTISPVPNIKELMCLLTEDLRIEEAELKKLDANKVCEYSEAYRTTNIKKLCSLLRRI